MFIQALFNGVFQVLLFGVIPFIWWLLTARKKENFFHWIGLHGFHIKHKQKYFALFGAALVVTFALGEIATYLKGSLEAADSAYKGMGAVAIPALGAYAFIQTALSEEILFRGFLLKRLSNKLGFQSANLIQAVMFGAIHLVLVWGHVSLLAGTVIIIYPMLVAVFLAYLNEKYSDGSILPSWLLHGLLNFISGLIAAL